MLMKPIPFEDVEVKPDGIIYLPEIKYRRILNQAFGPGGWGMAPRGELMVGEKVVTREYALLVHGRYVDNPPPHGPPLILFWSKITPIRSCSPLTIQPNHADICDPCHPDSSPKPAASANSLATTTASPPPARAASPTR